MHKFKIWINAARLRTLPLSLSCVVIELRLRSKKIFLIPKFFFSILTTIALQILSNFANDYGDFLKIPTTKSRWTNSHFTKWIDYQSQNENCYCNYSTYFTFIWFDFNFSFD